MEQQSLFLIFRTDLTASLVSSTFIYTGGDGGWQTSINDAPNQAMMVAANFSSASMFSIGDGSGSKDFAVPDFSRLSQSEL